MEYVNSSVIRGIEYDASSRVLSILFVDGKMYRYRNVPSHIVDRFLRASSKGQYFNKHVRGRYLEM